MPKSEYQSFYAAPFAIDGELLGVGAWQLSALSPRWLTFAREVLKSAGAQFNGCLPPPFERVALRYTSAGEAALATFCIGAVPVASSAYLRGGDTVAERQLLEMFVGSARRSEVVRQCQKTREPFAEVFSISERPLHTVIAWGTQGSDADIISQLGNHFAGAFLCEVSNS